MEFKNILVILLVTLAIVLQILGGYMDMRDVPFMGPGVSKEHMWSDATFLLLLALFIHNFKFV